MPLGGKEGTMEKIRVFIDMDGVQAVWNNDVTLEEVAAPGYFQKVEPDANVLDMVRRLLKNPNVEVYSCSSTLQDNHSESDKRKWIEKNLPEMEQSRCLFPVYGVSKSEYVENMMGKRITDILIEDNTKNLQVWHGVGIKMFNGINGTHGTWMGLRIDHRMSGSLLELTVSSIAAEIQKRGGIL